jgi:hypothetical protein
MGTIDDLGICVPPISAEDGRQCRDAFDRAAVVSPEERAQLLTTNCIIVPFPAICSELEGDFECFRAVYEAGDEVSRPGWCDVEGLEVVIRFELRCEMDAIAMVPAIVAEMAPQA